MKFIKGLLKFFIGVVITFIIIALGTFFLIHTSETQLPDEISKNIEDPLNFTDLMRQIHLGRGATLSKKDINTYLYHQQESYKNSLVKINYVYFDSENGEGKIFINVTPKIERYGLNKINVELRGKGTLDYEKPILGLNVEGISITRLPLPGFILNPLIEEGLSIIDHPRILAYDEGEKEITFDLSNLYIDSLGFSEKGIEYMISTPLDGIQGIDYEKINNLIQNGIDDAILLDLKSEIEALNESDRIKVFDYLEEVLSPEEFSEIQDMFNWMKTLTDCILYTIMKYVDK